MARKQTHFGEKFFNIVLGGVRRVEIGCVQLRRSRVVKSIIKMKHEKSRMGEVILKGLRFIVEGGDGVPFWHEGNSVE